MKKFFLQHNSRSLKRITERIDAIYQAVPVTNDEAVLLSEATVALGLLALLKTLCENIDRLDQQIQQLVAVHPDTPLFASLPGAGAVMIPRLIVAFGSSRERYQSAYEMQCYSGIAPITEASGKHEWIHFRWACPKFLRQTFHEYAFLSIRDSEWANAFYQHKRENDVAHPHRRPGIGLQMDPHYLPMLEGWKALRREVLHGLKTETQQPAPRRP